MEAAEQEKIDCFDDEKFANLLNELKEQESPENDSEEIDKILNELLAENLDFPF